MFTLKAIFMFCLTVSLCLIHSTSAGYTSEETDVKSKSFYSAVNTILGSTDTSRKHHKHIYGERLVPCLYGGSCPTDIPSYVTGRPEVPRDSSSCPNPSGCAIVASSPNSNSVSSPPQRVYSNGAYGTQYPTSPSFVSAPYQGGFYDGSYASNYSPYPSSVPVSGFTQAAYVTGTYGSSAPFQPPSPSGYGYSSYSAPHGTLDGYGPSAPPVSIVSYNNRQPSYPYGQGHGRPGYYGYQGERGYSDLNHSLKTNSEYTEVGTHNGPLQQAHNGYGYGSGYGGYMGMYNRPGF